MVNTRFEAKVFFQKTLASNSFLKELRADLGDTKLMMIWDGASYHKSEEMQEYLKEINADLDETEWKISCCLLAPHAPDQNPVEDIWLKGKNFLIRG